MTEPVLTLFGRPGCHLCEDMAAGLSPFLGANGLALQWVDVDSDPALRTRFGMSVPLLFHGEREICRYYLDLAAFRSWLTEAR